MAEATLTHEQYQQRQRIPILDGVRAISILLVVTYHPAYPGVWPVFHGATGVSIFFVLSGFLITMLLLREEARYGSVSLVGFYIRRLFRIAPLFLLAFACYLVLILVLGMVPERRDSFVANIPYFLLFLPEHSIYFSHLPEPVPFSGSWSLGIEEKFYFVWPVLGFVALALRRRLRLVALVVILAVTLACSWWQTDLTDSLAPYGLLALGCLLAITLDAKRGYAVVSRLGRPVPLFVLSVVFVAVQLGTGLIAPQRSLYVIYGGLVAALLCALVVTRSNAVDWLRTRPMLLLGQLSYGLYLFHNFALNLVENIIPPTSFPLSLLSTTLALAASVALVWVMHVLIERPCTRIGHKLSRGYRSRHLTGLGAEPVPEPPAQTVGPIPLGSSVRPDPSAPTAG